MIFECSKSGKGTKIAAAMDDLHHFAVNTKSGSICERRNASVEESFFR